MNDLVGIIRNAAEIQEALAKIGTLRERYARVSVTGTRHLNPGWHLALDLRNMFAVSECVAKAALKREESRGGHTRDDFPKMEPKWRKVNLICSAEGESINVTEQPLITMRDDLLELFQLDELGKYLTDDELAAVPNAGGSEGHS